MRARRLAGILRGLSGYYYKEPTLLFLVRLAQGLVHMGKGLLTLSPYHSDHVLLSGEWRPGRGGGKRRGGSLRGAGGASTPVQPSTVLH